MTERPQQLRPGTWVKIDSWKKTPSMLVDNPHVSEFSGGSPLSFVDLSEISGGAMRNTEKIGHFIYAYHVSGRLIYAVSICPSSLQQELCVFEATEVAFVPMSTEDIDIAWMLVEYRAFLFATEYARRQHKILRRLPIFKSIVRRRSIRFAIGRLPLTMATAAVQAVHKAEQYPEDAQPDDH